MEPLRRVELHEKWVKRQPGGKRLFLHPGNQLSFTRTNLEGADLRAVHLSNIHFRESNLEGVNFQGARITGCHLDKANLTRANFQNANLLGSSLCEAILTETIFISTSLNHTSLADTDFTKANIRNASFLGAFILHTSGLPEPQNLFKKGQLVTVTNEPGLFHYVRTVKDIFRRHIIKSLCSGRLCVAEENHLNRFDGINRPYIKPQEE